MAVAPTSASKNNISDQSEKKKTINNSKKRTKCPGVCVIHGRIYDSENGKTCYQCRQKTLDFSANCKNQAKKKPCPLKFCHTCLFNRYGEKAEEMTSLEDWLCPKCRGRNVVTNPLVHLCTQPKQVVFPLFQTCCKSKVLKMLVITRVQKNWVLPQESKLLQMR